MKTPFKLSALALLSLLCASAPARGDGVDAYVEGRLRALHIPGASLAVVRGGRVVKTKGYGLANIETRYAATPSTLYEIGSVTKQFTAAAVLLLVEEGKVALEDPVTKYFPDAPAAWGRITLRHLLTHTSGIRNHVAVPGYLDIFRTSITSKTYPTTDELLKEFYKLPSEFEPGETWAYDNTGYYLLGLVVEKASGKSYWQFMDERVFKPLGMNSTRSTDTRPVVHGRAAGYEWVKGSYENRPVLAPFVAFSAGSILSSVEEMARWEAGLSAGRLLKASSLEQMWTPARTRDGAVASFDYGFGWFVGSYHGRRFVQHSGGTPGFSSVIYRFPEDRLAVIILTNHSDRILDQLAIEIAGMYVPALRRAEAGADPDPPLSLRLKEVFAGLAEGRHDPAQFTPPMRTFLNTATGKSFWQWAAYHGALTSFAFSDREDSGGGRLLRYRVGLGGEPYWVSFMLAGDGRIAQITWW